MENTVAKTLAVDSASAVIRDQWIRFHVVDKLFALDLGPVYFAPEVSYDFDCVPLGGQLRVRRVTMGRLRLNRSSSNRAVRKFFPKLRTLPTWAVLADLSEINAEDGEVHIVVKR